MINFSTKTNQRPLGQEQPIFNEQHTVGITAVSTVTPNYIRLVEVPLFETPSSVVIPGYVETVNPPVTNQFKVDYISGRILFDPSKNGLSVQVSYKGRGSIVDAEDIDELQNGVNADGGGGGGGGLVVNPIYITGNRTLLLTDSYILANVTGGSIIITLPTASGNNGQRYAIKRIVFGGSPELNSNTVTLNTFGGQMIDGNSSYLMSTLEEGVVLYSDNFNWQFESKHTRDKIWTGSAGEYAAIVTHDPHTVYIVV